MSLTATQAKELARAKIYNQRRSIIDAWIKNCDQDILVSAKNGKFDLQFVCKDANRETVNVFKELLEKRGFYVNVEAQQLGGDIIFLRIRWD